MSQASDTLLRMLTFDIRARMIEDQRRRHAVGLATREEFERLVSDVKRIEKEPIDYRR